MSAELDMSQYMDLFLQEAEEQLDVLEQETLKLEKEPTPERMNIIFRAAHTLKGSSRAMGFSNFAGLTHEMENVLDRLRSNELGLTTEIADSLLRCIDALGAVKAKISAGEGDQSDVSSLVSELASFVTADAVAAATAAILELPSEINNALKNCTGSAPVFRAHFKLSEDCVMKYVRAFMAINVVQDGGELLATLPEPDALEDERFGREFELYFQHKEPISVLKNRFNGIGEVESFEVEEFKQATTILEEAAPEPSKTVQETTTTTQAARKAEPSATVRVDVSRLDELMNLVGELVIDRTRIAQIGIALGTKYPSDDNVDALGETVGHIGRITSDLQDQLMKARMLPIETVFNRFPRMVRDLAQKVGKEVELELVGGETELDRSVIESIGDPLLHILRNCVDHGVEPPEEREKLGKPRAGMVRVSARHQENHIVIDIEDDGRGISVERVKAKAVETGLLTRDAAEKMTDKEAFALIFASGLSTASEVTEVSGRGVGMDIVRSNIQKLGGLIDLESEPGKGTRFTLRLPLTLAIIRGLLVTVTGVVYVLPLGSVVETLLVPKTQIQQVAGREVIVIRGSTTPLVRMHHVFDVRGRHSADDADAVYVVIVGLAEQRIGLVVDHLVGEQEVVIKSLNRFCGDVRGISGATILGNGNVALIVDVASVLNMENQ